MKDLILHNDYQDPTIPFIETTRVNVTTHGVDFVAYDYKREVYLNLSQVANVVNKGASSLFYFCARNTQESLMGKQSVYFDFQAYTTTEPHTKGKPPRIVHINVASLYWGEQAAKGNADALKLLVQGTRENIVKAVDEVLHPKTPMLSTTELLRLGYEASQKLEALEGAMAHMPIVEALVNSRKDNLALPGYMSTYEVRMRYGLPTTCAQKLASKLDGMTSVSNNSVKTNHEWVYHYQDSDKTINMVGKGYCVPQPAIEAMLKAEGLI